MDKDRGPLSRLCRIIKQELARWKEPLHIRVDYDKLKTNIRILKVQFFVYGMYMLIGGLISLLARYHDFLHSLHTSPLSTILQIGRLAINSLPIIFLQFWLHKMWVRIVATLLCVFAYMLIIDSLVGAIDRGNNDNGFKDNFRNMVWTAAIFHSISPILMNQPFFESIIISLIVAIQPTVYFFIRISSAKLSYHLPRTILIYFYISIAYFNRFKHQNNTYAKLCSGKKRVEEIVRLVDSLSIIPAYLLRLKNVLSMDKLESMEDTRRRLAASYLEVCRSSASVQTPPDVSYLFETLDKLYFTRISTATCFKRPLFEEEEVPNRPVSPNSSNKLKADMECLRWVVENRFNGKRVTDIIVMIVHAMNAGKLKQLSENISLSNLSEIGSQDDKDQKLFQVDLYFVEYMDEPVLVTCIKNTSHLFILEALERQSKNLDSTLAGIAHDMRAPLHTILGYTDMISFRYRNDAPLASSLLENLHKISANCQHLKYLLNDILDSAQIAQHRMTLTLSRFNMYDLLVECADMIVTVGKREGGEGVREVQVSEDSVISLYSDAHRLKRVILTLLGVSLRIIREGICTLGLRAVESGHNTVVVVVECNGMVADCEQRAEIFGQDQHWKRGENGGRIGYITATELVGKLGPVEHIDFEATETKSTFSFKIFETLGDKDTSPKSRKVSSIHLIQVSHTPSIPSIPSSSQFLSRLPSTVLSPRHTNTTNRVYSHKLSNHIDMDLPSNGGSNTLIPLRKILSPVFEKRVLRKDTHNPDSNEGSDIGETSVAVPRSIGKKHLYDLGAASERELFFHPNTDTGDIDGGNNRKLKMLIVEDDDVNRDILTNYLARYFHPLSNRYSVEIDSEFSLDSALAKVSNLSDKGIGYSLVITDYYLDVLYTGTHLVSRIKSICTKHSLLYPSFILVSGAPDISPQSPSPQNRKPDKYFAKIVKPFTFELFSAVMDRWLRYYYLEENRLDTSSFHD